jgi:4-amino-4-deoxy-L-arabinose transferase-like glycosyltransferase
MPEARSRHLLGRLPAALIAVVVLSLVLNIFGIWWGLPAMPETWAPDEFSPLRIHVGVAQRFSNGWFELYPPCHVYVLALALLPIELLIATGVTTIHDPTTYATAFYITRFVSVAMAAGLVLIMYRLGRELFDSNSGVFAALTVALMPPLVFYAKLANVEVPYLFWLAWSFLSYVRILARHRMRDYVTFGVTAALAIGTKDQAYGFYVAMPVAIAISDRAMRRRDGLPAALWRSIVNERMVATLVIGIATLVAVHNLPFNWSGAVERFRAITGPMTLSLQEFPNTFAGHVGMVALGVRHLLFVLGLPCLLASVGGLAYAALEWRRYPRALALLPPIVTYWVLLIVPIMYHYDRYLLPVALILSLFSGLALSRLIAGGGRMPAVRRGLVAAAIAVSLAYAVSIDLLLAGDARYAAERWLRHNLAPGTRVMAIGHPPYLPRLEHLDVVMCFRPTLAVLAEAPDYLIMTSIFEEWRFQEDPEALEFFRALRAGATPYELAFSHRAQPALNLLDVRNVRTNLDKINPRIRVYRRSTR